MNKKNSGQGLIEMIVALGIIIVGVIGSLSLSVVALSSSRESETRVIAANLAREGIEVARNIRDSNWLAGCPDEEVEAELYNWDSEPAGCYQWDTGLKGETLTPNTAIATFDPNNGKWSLNFEAVDIDDEITQFFIIDGVYIQTTAPPEGLAGVSFYRLITLKNICLDDDGVEIIKEEDCQEATETKIGIEVSSHIRWSEHSRVHNLTAQDRLYDWR